MHGFSGFFFSTAMQHQNAPEEQPVEGEVIEEEKPVQQEENESFLVSIGRAARSNTTLIVLLILAFAVNRVAEMTEQQDEGWVKFLIDKTTFFAVWGIIVVAGFEFAKVCLEAFFSFLERLIHLYTRFKRIKR